MSVFPHDEEVCISSDDVDHVKSNGISKTGTSPEASSTTSDSPTPTNSVHEKNWSSHWQALGCEEQRQLLGTEEESDRQSDGEVEEVWEITPEQREYYKAQFFSLQPDSGGLLSGPVAREFFGKSRLPIPELRKIWQLSDVSRDGALSLEEFNTAMHLVVLRRNNIQIPEVLPPSLVPVPPLVPPAAAAATATAGAGVVPPSTAAVVSSSSAPGQTSPHRGKQWTKFVESPTSSLSSLSSPGPKPVNFDFHKAAVEQDPKILHPVAVRVTPGPPETEEGVLPLADLRPLQRPQPKKSTAPGSGAIPPPPPLSLPDETVLSKKEGPPPPPPPRPFRQHARSSSLDLTRLGRTGGLLNMPPTVPPRISPSVISPKKNTVSEGEVGFANFAQFPEDHSKQQSGAFQVYRKPASESSEPGNWSPADIPLDVKLEVREAHNAVLRRHCSELQTCLARLKEERVSLQAILDQLLAQ